MYECDFRSFVLRFCDLTPPFHARDLGSFGPLAAGATLGPGIPQGTPTDTQGKPKHNPVQQITMGKSHLVCYFRILSSNSGAVDCCMKVIFHPFSTLQ